jgi:uncharacterized protein (DUF983 family)
MNKENKGTSIPTTLLIVFVVLKLTGNIDWSWWWVLSPLWIPVLLLVPFVVLGAILLASDKPLASWPRKDYNDH